MDLPKKLPALLTALMMLSPLSVGADDTDSDTETTYTEGSFTYTVEDDAATLVTYSDTTETIIEIPNEIGGYPVKSVEKQLLFEHESVEKIIISSNLENIGMYAFFGCKNLSEFEVSDDNPYLEAIDGILFSEDKTILLSYPLALTDTTYTIPDTVEYVDYGAFAMSENLEKIVIPDAVTALGDAAFGWCTALTEISIPDAITEIPATSFYNCISLSSIEWPSSLETIGKNAFGRCSSLTEIVLPDTLTTIGQGAFALCTGITSVSLPQNLEYLNSSVFTACTSLKSITLPPYLQFIGENAVGYNLDSTDEFVLASEFTIYGVADTLAQTYAEGNSITFVAVDSTDTDSNSEDSSDTDSNSDADYDSDASNADSDTDSQSQTNNNASKYAVPIIIGAVIIALIIVLSIKNRKSNHGKEQDSNNEK